MIIVLTRGLWLALAIEAITLIARFGLGLESTRDTQFLASLTLGYRIHHGYVGVVLIVIALLIGQFRGQPIPQQPGWVSWLAVIGVGLVASDLIHHFLVLWPLTGEHQFDLRYLEG